MEMPRPDEATAAEPTWSRGRLQKVPTCPACGSDARHAPFYRRRDDAAAMPDVWEMVTCANCESLYMDPRPDDESLPRAYDDYFTHNRVAETYSDKGMSGVLWRMINGYLNARFGMRRQPASRLGHLLFMLAVPWRLKLDYYCRNLYLARYPDRGALLDLGCGNGSFLERAVEMGWDALGCEPDENAVAVCRGAGLEVVHGDVFTGELDGRAFDVVTVSHVIEHVPDIHRALSRIHSIVKPGGTVWFALPNPDSIIMKLFASAALNLHFPCHLCIPSQKRFAGLLRKHGFSGVRAIRRGVQTRSHWDDSVAIARAQDLPLPGRFSILSARLLSEVLSSISVKWAEESVFVATRD